MDLKKCIKCDFEKPLSEFMKHSSGRYRGVCRECWNKSNRIRYHATHGNKLEERKQFRESDPKVCIKCEIEKPLTDFNFHNREKGQHRNFCKICQKGWAKQFNAQPENQEKRKEYAEKNKERCAAYKEIYKNDPEKRAANKKYHRNYWLLRKYNLTLDEYQKMLDVQGGKCAICGTDDPGNGVGNFVVDHDHETGENRGLLCRQCNAAIGFLREDLDLVHKTAKYLETHKT